MFCFFSDKIKHLYYFKHIDNSHQLLIVFLRTLVLKKVSLDRDEKIKTLAFSLEIIDFGSIEETSKKKMNINKLTCEDNGSRFVK